LYILGLAYIISVHHVVHYVMPKYIGHLTTLYTVTRLHVASAKTMTGVS